MTYLSLLNKVLYKILAFLSFSLGLVNAEIDLLILTIDLRKLMNFNCKIMKQLRMLQINYKC